MRYIIRILLIVFLSFPRAGFAQAPPVRGIYVNFISSWLGNPVEENAILDYCFNNGFNYITLYDLNHLTWTSYHNNQLASFLSRAKNNYGVVQIGAAGETYNFFSNYILPYNNSRTISEEKFDVLNFEFEFWQMANVTNYYGPVYLTPNGYTADSAGAFAFAIRQFNKIDSIANLNGLLSEIYLGWPNRGQMQQIAAKADRILLHAYRTNDNDVYQYTLSRLNDIASISGSSIVLPIFSSESNFMGPWLQYNSIVQPYHNYNSYYQQEDSVFKSKIDLEGYQWFLYSLMPQSTLTNASINANGPVTFCTGDDVTLTASTGLYYYWSPGGQTTRSITVDTSGSFFVTIISGNGDSAVSPTITTTSILAGPAPTVTASGPLGFCAGGSVTLTANAGSSFIWSDGNTSPVRTVTTSGNYYVTQNDSGCAQRSNSLNVIVSNPPASPTIISSHTNSLCPGDTAILSTNSNDSLLWSTGSVNRTIAVHSPGTFTVRAYSGPNCFTTSSAFSVSVAGPDPVITANGPLTFCETDSVTLSCTGSGSMSWSSGQTTASIIVRATGDYFVTTNDNGCIRTTDTFTVSTIPLPPQPVITAGSPLTFCPGDTAVLYSTGSGNQLVWSTGDTGSYMYAVNAGTFSVTAFSGPGCFTSSAPVTTSLLSLPSPATLSMRGNDTLGIQQPVAILRVQSNDPYIWSTSQTSRSIVVRTAGNYFVTLTSADGCTMNSDTIVIYSNGCIPPPKPFITVNGPRVLGPGQTTQLTSSIPTGNVWSTGDTTASIVVSSAGNYTVTVYSDSSCFSSSNPVVITSLFPRISSAGPSGHEPLISVYPNPAGSELFILYNADADGTGFFRLEDLTGRGMIRNEYTATTGINTWRLDVSNLPAGIYFVAIEGRPDNRLKVVIE